MLLFHLQTLSVSVEVNLLQHAHLQALVLQQCLQLHTVDCKSALPRLKMK
jgi:hypothetical protein